MNGHDVGFMMYTILQCLTNELEGLWTLRACAAWSLGQTKLYLSHRWSTAPSFVTNPPFAHATTTDDVKKESTLSRMSSDRHHSRQWDVHTKTVVNLCEKAGSLQRVISTLCLRVVCIYQLFRREHYEDLANIKCAIETAVVRCDTRQHHWAQKWTLTSCSNNQR